MRRTTAVTTCIAAFALFIPAFDAPDVPPTQTLPSRPAAAADAANRVLRQLSLSSPAVPRGAIQRLAASGVVPRATVAAPKRAPVAPDVVHTVQAGDSLWTISTRHGVAVEALASANDLTLTSILQPGQKLTIPASGRAAPAPEPVRAAHPAGARSAPARAAARPAATSVHVVTSGETLWAIARRYGARVEDLMALNDIGDSDWIKPGQRLVISGRDMPRHRQIAAQTRAAQPVMADARSLRMAGAFFWPARGVLTSRFGWRYRRHHDGIDLAAPRGTPIYAARDGVVDFAGWKGGYGRVVYLNHGNGIVTVYGHASSLHAKPGQHVEKGQMIARVGCTGSCTGSHVHFEVRVSGQAVNPLQYLR